MSKDYELSPAEKERIQEKILAVVQDKVKETFNIRFDDIKFHGRRDRLPARPFVYMSDEQIRERSKRFREEFLTIENDKTFTYRPWNLKKDKPMKVKLKTVQKLMEEGFKFTPGGDLAILVKGEIIVASHVHLLGTIVDKDAWTKRTIEEEIKEEKTEYDLLNDFNHYLDEDGSLVHMLKDSKDDLLYRKSDVDMKIELN